MRVLLVNPSASAGAFVHRLGNALVDEGADVELWTGPMHETFARAWSPSRYRTAIRFYRHTQHRSWQAGPFRPAWRAARLLGHGASVARLLRAAPRFDVVHLYFLSVPVLDTHWVPLLARRSRVAYHVHNLWPHDAPRDDAVRACFGRIYRAAHVLFAHNDEAERGLVTEFGVSPARIVRVPLGNMCEQVPAALVPDPASLGLSPGGAPVVLMLGEVRRNKGVDVLLRAGALLRDRGIPFRIVVAGRQPAGLPAEPALAASLGLADHVEFRSRFIPEEQVPAFLAAAAVVAFPYRTIDQSAGAVWAISYGRPIVGSRVGGLVDLAEGGGAGLLVPPDDPAALAAALERLLGDADLRARLGAAGRRYAETALAWGPIARRTLEAYRAAAR